MKKRMVSPTEWGASLTPPIGPIRARELCRGKRVKGAKLAGSGERGVWLVPADARDPRNPVGRPRGAHK